MKVTFLFLYIFISFFHFAHDDSKGVHVVQRAIGLSEIRLNLDADKDHVISSYGVVTTGKYDVKSAAVDISPGAKGFVSNFAYQISQHRCYEREKDGLTNRVAY